MPPKKTRPTDPIASYKYPSKRKNIPTAGLAGQGIIQEAPKVRYGYNPHLPPVLRSATDAGEADRLPELLRLARQRAFSEEETELLAAALRGSMASALEASEAKR